MMKSIPIILILSGVVFIGIAIQNLIKVSAAEDESDKAEWKKFSMVYFSFVIISIIILIGVFVIGIAIKNLIKVSYAEDASDKAEWKKFSMVFLALVIVSIIVGIILVNVI